MVIYLNSDEVWRVILKALESIELEQYITENDEIGQRFLLRKWRNLFLITPL